MPFYLQAAIRYILARPKSSAVALGGVAVAVGALIIVLGITNGLSDYLIQRLLGLEPHIEVLAGYEMALEDFQSPTQAIQNQPNIKTMMPFVQGQALVRRGISAPRGIYIRGVPAPEEVLAPYLDNQGEGLLMGSELARRLNISPGQNVTISGGQNLVTFTVGGTFTTGLEEYDQRLLYLPLSKAQELLGYTEDQVTGLALWLNNPMASQQTAEDIQGLTGLWVRTWQEKQRNLLAAVAVERQALIAILMATFLVAGIGVGNVLWLNIWEKRRDIGVLQALGAKRHLLIKIFLFQALFLGFFGLILGLALGLLVLFWLRGRPIFLPELTFAQYIPVVIRTQDILLATILALSIATFAGLIVVWQVGKGKLVQVIQHE